MFNIGIDIKVLLEGNLKEQKKLIEKIKASGKKITIVITKESFAQYKPMVEAILIEGIKEWLTSNKIPFDFIVSENQNIKIDYLISKKLDRNEARKVLEVDERIFNIINKYLYYIEENRENLSLEDLKKYYQRIKSIIGKSSLEKKLSRKTNLDCLLRKLLRVVIQSEIQISTDVDKDQQYLYVVNHTNVEDFPIVCNVINQFFYIIVGDEILKVPEGLIFKLRGAYFLDRFNKVDRLHSKISMIQALTSGISGVLFPEGTWNNSENLPMLPINKGFATISKITNTPVVPIVMEYFNQNCYVTIGSPINFDLKMSDEECAKVCEDQMITLRFDLWEKYSKALRSEVNKESFEELIKSNIKKYSQFDIEKEEEVILKRGVTMEEAFALIYKLYKK